MKESYLPIGSVVVLKNNKKVMVIGYYSVEYADDIVVYDYSGCAYPEGLMIKSSFCSFNQNDIKSVEFEGYKAEEYVKLNNNLITIDNEFEVDLEKDTEKFDDVERHEEVEKLEDLNNFDNISFDTLEHDEVKDALEVPKTVEEPVKDDVKDEFVMPHYEFDESGIIIRD